MLTRRGFVTCAFCALSGFLATGVEAESPPPSGIRREILKRTEGPTPDFEMIIAAADILPWFEVPRHIHPGIESAYIVSGGGLFLIDGEAPREIVAGDVAQVPTRRPHSLKNGGQPTRIVSTYVLEKGQPIAIPA